MSRWKFSANEFFSRVNDWFSGRAAKLTKTLCNDDDDGDDDLIIKTCRCLAIWFSGQGSRPRKAFRYFSLPHLDDLELQSVPQSSPPPLNRESYRSHLLYVPRFQSMYCDGTWSNYKRSGIWVDPPLPVNSHIFPFFVSSADVPWLACTIVLHFENLT